MRQAKPILHGRDHAPGGADPLPFVFSTTPNALLDYAEAPPGVFNVTATTEATAQLWIQGNAITVDGDTTVKVTVWVALGTTDHDLVLELYMDNVDQGRIGQIGIAPAITNSLSTSFIGIGHVKPDAGSHTFDIRAFTDVGSTSSLLNPTPWPAVAFSPSHYAVTVEFPFA